LTNRDRLTNEPPSDAIKVIREQGMPSYRHHDLGNLYVQFDVKFPDRLGGPDGASLTDDEVAMLERVLPPRNKRQLPPANAETEEFTLESINDVREGARAHGATGDDEDEEMGGGGERVQCASQ